MASNKDRKMFYTKIQRLLSAKQAQIAFGLILVVSALTLAGRVVWPLVGIAALAAWLRKPLGKNWRTIHYLNYLAFWLVTAHAILIGTNFQSWVMRVLAILLALITVAVLIRKRLPKSRPKR